MAEYVQCPEGVFGLPDAVPGFWSTVQGDM